MAIQAIWGPSKEEITAPDILEKEMGQGSKSGGPSHLTPRKKTLIADLLMDRMGAGKHLKVCW